ncbi:hypothetical protein BH23PAT2_BH23PAT2_04800 [soil metagenome]
MIEETQNTQAQTGQVNPNTAQPQETESRELQQTLNQVNLDQTTGSISVPISSGRRTTQQIAVTPASTSRDGFLADISAGLIFIVFLTSVVCIAVLVKIAKPVSDSIADGESNVDAPVPSAHVASPPAPKKKSKKSRRHRRHHKHR